jgi:CheY-like chemotaxis protein
MARILIADDEIGILDLLKKFLRQAGHEVVAAATSGDEALDLARELKPELALMDIVMPGEIDGIRAAGIMKGELQIPTIFITGYANQEYRDRAKFVEPYGYIIKPFKLEQLQATIEMALYKEAVNRPQLEDDD